MARLISYVYGDLVSWEIYFCRVWSGQPTINRRLKRSCWCDIGLKMVENSTCNGGVVGSIPTFGRPFSSQCHINMRPNPHIHMRWVWPSLTYLLINAFRQCMAQGLTIHSTTFDPPTCLLCAHFLARFLPRSSSVSPSSVSQLHVDHGPNLPLFVGFALLR